MPRHARIFSSLECNDIDLLYTDADMSLLALARYFQTSIRSINRILGLLKRGKRYKEESSGHLVVEIGDVDKRFHTKNEAIASRWFLSALGSSVPHASVKLSKDGRHFEVVSGSTEELQQVFDLFKRIPKDEDDESLWSQTISKWTTLIFGDSAGHHGNPLRLTLSVPCADLGKLWPSVTG